MDWQKKIGFQEQLLTLFIVSLAITAYSFPRLSSLLVYDRQAILSGELWRLFTAPLVHFSASHIFWDILVFTVAGFAINASGFRRFWLVCSFAATIPGIIFLLAYPNLEYYGGLSGLAVGAAAYFSLCSMSKSKGNKLIWLCFLLAMGSKILVETVMNEPIFVQAECIPFRVLPSTHIVGFLGAIISIIWTKPNISIESTKQ